MMRFAIFSTIFLAFSTSTVKAIKGATTTAECSRYEFVKADSKCPSGNGIRLDREMNLTKEACYQLCADNADCEFFTFGEEEGKRFSGLCMTCTRVDEVPHLNEGFNHYVMEDPNCSKSNDILESNHEEIPYESSCEDPYVFIAENKKCPFIDQTERLWRSDDYSKMTIADCYQECRNTEECKYFTYGANHPEGDKWEGLCILCTENAADEKHQGFLHYWMNDECKDNPNYQGGGGKVSGAPTPSPTMTTGGVKGDPHFKTWDGQLYDFHGICDLVLLRTPDFMNGLGMDIHIRSSKTRQWSYISRAVVKIGSETFELSTSRDRNNYSIEYFVNGISGKDDNLLQEDNMKLPNTIAGYEIQYHSVNSQQKEYIINLGEDGETLSLHSWKHMIRIDLQGCKAKNFASSVGLMGTFTHSHKVGRDNSTIIENLNEFGQEWQVLPGEQNLFQTVEGPQAPSKCEIASKSQLRRRLSQSEVTIDAAELACASITNKDDFDLCVFDVIATGDVGSVGVY